MNRLAFAFLTAWAALAGAQAAAGEEPLAWAPDGKRIAYCGTGFSPEPALWLIEAASGSRRRLLSPAVIGAGGCSPIWHPVRNTLLINRENGFLLVDASAGRVLSSRTDARYAEFSPDGKWISYVSNGKLLVRSLVDATTRVIASSDSATLRAEPDWLYRNRLGMRTAYWWAPDSSSIAYLETTRQAKLFPTAGDPLPGVGLQIADIVSGGRIRTVQMPAGEAYLGQIVWSPDSLRLAIQWLDRRQTSLTVLMADSRTGIATSILKETDPYWINLDPRGLAFLPSGTRFLWTSERDGFRHIYLYDGAGGLVSQITRGEWAVTAIDAVDEHTVIYTSTEPSPVERYVYAKSLDGAARPVRLTSERGWHAARVAPRGGAFVDFTSSFTSRPSIRLVGASGRETTIGAPEVSGLLLPVELAAVRTHDGLVLNAMLIRPPGFDPSKTYPAVVLAPAGPQQQTVRDASDSEEFRWAQTMARKGFIVFAADGRGSGGRGHRFEEPIHYRLGGMELPDQLDALNFLRRLGYVDMTRVGVFGSDYAGMLALGAMMHSHGIYRAGFADSPITDWTAVDAFTAERYLGPKTAAAIPYSESSPNEYAGKLEGRMLVTANAGRGESLAQIEALRRELEEKHMLRPGRAAIESTPRGGALEQAARFFVEALMPEAAVASSGPRSPVVHQLRQHQ